MAIFLPLFDELNKADLRYVVVGGLATVLHGYARLTVDIDLMVDLAPAETEKMMTTLQSLGFVPQLPLSPASFANVKIREQWKTEKNMQVFSMVDPHNPLRIVDLFVENVIPFGDLWARAKVVQIESIAIRIASLVDLIHLKRLAGRPQDLVDIEQLEKIQQLEKGERDE